MKILGGAVVCNECELRGDITIGARTVIHPKARIVAESGPIIIGILASCLFTHYCQVCHLCQERVT